MTAAWVVAWVIVAVLAVGVGSVLTGRTGHAALAVVQDGLVPALVAAWPIALVAALTGHGWLAAVAAALAAYHLRLVLPRVLPNRVPAWVDHGPHVRLLVANVFVDNATPEELAAVLVGARADVAVVAEWNARFTAALDAAGGDAVYPHRLFDPDDGSDYAVAVVAAQPFGPGSGMVTRGPLTVADAALTVAGQQLRVIALNPMAAVDPEGFPTWDAQVRELHHYLRTVRGPFVVAGDLNTTTVRPRMRRLLRTGLLDLHESLGRGLSASFKLAADGALAKPGAVVRLDHVLMSAGVRATAADDLPSAGSDHVPFVADVVLRPRRHRPRRP